MILGTAGHIDHGKTALIRALTGVDTDRLPEEKARGITIDLGFAPLDLGAETRVGVVDVPGHEALVRTMVAGATGIDVVLLVVAADEGVMPQTREHVAICELLGIERGVVALTKLDAADPEVSQLAREEVTQLLASTRFASAELVPVSALTGEGLEALRAALARAVQAAPGRQPGSVPPRLPVDRAFAARGFGTVATGTLLDAPLCVGDAVEIYPSGRSGRVRGLQSHGEPVERVEPGMRCAVNLQGLEVADLPRGAVVSLPGALAATRVLDVQVSWLPGSPPVEHDGASIAFLTGTAERVGRLAPVGAEQLLPGEQGLARIHLEGEPVPVVPGDRFVARGFARTELYGATLGGGVVLDVAPPRRRRSDPQLVGELTLLASQPEPAAALEVRIARAGFQGAATEALARETGTRRAALVPLLEKLATEGRARTTAERWLSAEAVAQLERRALRALEEFHAREPLRPGMPRAAVQGALPENTAPGALDLVLHALEGQGRIVAEGELVRRSEHRPRLTSEQERHVAEILRRGREAGLEPPTLREWSQHLGVELDRVRPLLVHLEQRGELVRAPGELWFSREAIEALRERVIAHIRAHGPLDTPTYKRLIGTTRKHAVPLMELLDTQRVTLRKGDTRILRAKGD